MDHNGNDNCLDGVQCPRCGNASNFLVEGTAQFRLTDDGAEHEGDVIYDEDSAVWCEQCHHTAPLRAFYFDEEENERSNDENGDAGRSDDVGTARSGDQPRSTGVSSDTQHDASRLPESVGTNLGGGQRVSCPDTMRRGRNPLGGIGHAISTGGS